MTGLAIYFPVVIFVSGTVEWLIVRVGDTTHNHETLVFVSMWSRPRIGRQPIARICDALFATVDPRPAAKWRLRTAQVHPHPACRRDSCPPERIAFPGIEILDPSRRSRSLQSIAHSLGLP
jgi:hypothetical protein